MRPTRPAWDPLRPFAFDRPVGALTQPLGLGAAGHAGSESEGTPRLAFSDRTASFLDRNFFVVLTFAAAAAFQVVFLRLMITPDSWYTLVGGRLVSDGSLPHHDTLTVFAHDRSWV